MKGLASLEQREQLKGRSIIETGFSVLKDRLGLVTSLPRSLDGYLTHYILLLLAYQLARWVTHALGTPALPHPQFHHSGYIGTANVGLALAAIVSR